MIWSHENEGKVIKSHTFTSYTLINTARKRQYSLYGGKHASHWELGN